MLSFFKRPVVYILLVVTFATLTFSGCRSKDEVQFVEDFSGVELTYYKVFDDSEVIKPIIDEYVAKHPGLKINYRKFSDFEEYEKTILNEMAEGEGPDIFSMQNTWFKSNYKKTIPLPSTMGTPKDFESTFVNVAYNDLVGTDLNGQQQVFAVPMTVDTLALYYNKDHFEDRLASQGRPSATWEGIKEDVRLLNKEDSSFDRFDVSGIAMGRADNITRGVDVLYLLFLQYGVDFYDDLLSEAKFAAKKGGVFTYPAKEALDLFTSFAEESNKHYSWNEYVVDDDTKGQEIEAFAAGEVSMIIGYSYTYDDIVNYINLMEANGGAAIDKSAIRIAAIPQIYDPSVSSEKRVTYASYFAETVSRNSEYPDLAWDFLIELTSKANLEYYFDEVNKPTSRRDMIDDQRKHPIYGVFAEQTGFAESFPILDYYIYKDLFSGVIADANINGVSTGALVEAQDLITGMLPKDGIIVPLVELDETDEDDE